MNICVLIVTYNRLNKLKISLEHYEFQSRKPDRILVVDNHSNQETIDFLREWKSIDNGIKKTVVRLEKNFGGSGGFYYGMKKALELGFDWLWIADDDAYPEINCLSELKDFVMTHDCDAVCGCVVTKNGIDTFHRRRLIINKFHVAEENIPLDKYKEECFNVDLCSFVGSVFSWKVINQCGLPTKDYFIWYDDTEYALRLLGKFDIYCVPKIRIFHDASPDNALVNWKTYYGARNRLDMYRKHFSKRQLRTEVLLYKMRLLKNRIVNKKLYFVLHDAFVDFKRRKMGISEKYLPGKKI